MQTYSGVHFYPYDPRLEDIRIEDIAHSLSFQCRFNGHTKQFYSIADHSIRVALILPHYLQLSGLLHDAAEAYWGDMIRPIKLNSELGAAYTPHEQYTQSLIEMKFGLEYPSSHPQIKDADCRMLVTEKRDLLLHFPNSKWELEDSFSPLSHPIVPLPPSVAKDRFLALFSALSSSSSL